MKVLLKEGFRSKLKDKEYIIDFEENGIFNIEEVINKYNNYIYKMLKNSITKEEDIEEILSDTFVALWKNYNFLDKNINLKAYLIGITRNLVKKKYREYSKLSNLEDISENIYSYIDIEKSTEENEKIKLISIIISNMEEEERNIFIMFYYKGYKIKEISRKLNIGVSKVKVTLHRLRKKVKKIFKESGYDYGR